MELAFRKTNGELTRYAFGCGHVQTFNLMHVDHYSTDADSVAMTLENGVAWNVRTRLNGVADWHIFDNHTDARKLWGATKALIIARHNYTIARGW